jgi:hypothetical protein
MDGGGLIVANMSNLLIKISYRFHGVKETTQEFLPKSFFTGGPSRT